MEFASFVVCFFLSAALAGLDVHRFIQKASGTSPISYWRCAALYIFSGSVGACAIVLLVISRADPGGWVDKAVGLESGNPFARATLIAFGTCIILRAKLLDLKDASIGPDYIYELFRGWAANSYKIQAARQRAVTAKQISEQVTQRSTFADDLERMVLNAIDHRGDDVKKKICDSFDAAKLMQSNIDDNRSYHTTIIEISIDALGVTAIRRWAQSDK